MSHKNETTVLVLSLLITAGLLGAGYWWFKSNSSTPNTPENPDSVQSSPVPIAPSPISPRISIGEKSLVTANANSEKQAGVQAFASGDFASAIANFQSSLQANRNNPEALIYLNNARIGKQISYTIAASVPIGTDVNGALEMLRGVAQAQTEINQAGGIKGIPVKVAIANDDNNPEIAKQIATALVNNPDVLGVVGPYASDVTLAAGTTYNDGKLVVISPTSTSIKLSGFSRYVFRTVPSDYVAARALSDYMLNKLQRKNAAVFFNSRSAYSQSLKSEFVTAVSLGGGQVSNEFDLSEPGFSAARSIDLAIAQGAEVLMLAANTDTLDKALQVVQLNRKRLKLLGGDDVYTPKTLEVGGEAAVEMVLAVPWHINNDPTSNFPRQSRQLWGGDVSWRTALSYDATQALIAALQRNPTRTGVQKALISSDFSPSGASGVIRFLPSGDRNAAVILVRIQRGTISGTGYDFVPVRP
ncbi:ABC transporter substrate-binding protein [Coleofasciculus sp. FACHB-1120]|uniref:ABC transporter substrate-binding protein n=1 Tax=Coleofasciculus sp. FACHB-1120 TaxID=2692783 RepID=UPI0016830CF6|nr:ABC transporter substrate-binding protein [Coleofasciculus sp. FACHB-1120]MBD2744394.1 amino acid ABC transporter substrate-binding protein [Coleofasciculus sp. FACHB-1120]